VKAAAIGRTVSEDCFGLSRASLKFQAHQGTSLFAIAALCK